MHLRAEGASASLPASSCHGKGLLSKFNRYRKKMLAYLNGTGYSYRQVPVITILQTKGTSYA